MRMWNYAKFITLAILFLFLMVLLLEFQGGSRGEEDSQSQHVYVATGNMQGYLDGTKVEIFESGNRIDETKDGSEYKDQGSRDLLETEEYDNVMRNDYWKPRSPAP